MRALPVGAPAGVAVPAAPPASQSRLGIDGGHAVGISLCGELQLRVDGRDRTLDLHGRIGRRLLTYLVVRRSRAVARDELFEDLWPGRGPDDMGRILSPALSHLRRAVAPLAVEGRGAVRLVLPDTAYVDLEAARTQLDIARERAVAGLHQDAASAAALAAELCAGDVLPGEFGAWLDAVRRDAEHVRVEALQVAARSALEARAPEAALQHARTLTAVDPWCEAGHELLMRALAATGSAVQALRHFEELRQQLASIGTVPGQRITELHLRLLQEPEALSRAA